MSLTIASSGWHLRDQVPCQSADYLPCRGVSAGQKPVQNPSSLIPQSNSHSFHRRDSLRITRHHKFASSVFPILLKPHPSCQKNVSKFNSFQKPMITVRHLQQRKEEERGLQSSPPSLKPQNCLIRKWAESHCRTKASQGNKGTTLFPFQLLNGCKIFFHIRSYYFTHFY